MRLHIDVHLRTVPQGKHEYWRAYWTDMSGKEHTKSLGNTKKVTKREAQRACRMIERDIADSPLTLTDEYTGTLADIMHQAAAQRNDSSPNVRNLWLRSADLVEEYFESAIANRVKRTTASKYAKWLSESKGLSEQSVRHQISRIRTAVGAVVREGQLAMNPFDHIPAGVIKRDATWEYIEPERVLAVINHPDTPQPVALALALARFGGLRANEIEKAKWEHYDPDRRTLLVPNPNKGGIRTTKKRKRIVPADPALRSALGAAERSPSMVRILGKTRVQAVRTAIADHASAAGVQPWPDPLQNLRRACITDWCGILLPAAVAKIAGNSARVIMDHYYTVNADTMRKIAVE